MSANLLPPAPSSRTQRRSTGSIRQTVSAGKPHPYAHSTIVSAADLNAATLADVKTWFRDHYGATNAVVILAGNIDLATAREKVTRYFGGIPAGRKIAGPAEWVR